MKQKDFEGQVYSQLFKLIEANYDEIQAAKPHVSKNSTGYNLWDVWDPKTGVFDLDVEAIGLRQVVALLRPTPLGPLGGFRGTVPRNPSQRR